MNLDKIEDDIEEDREGRSKDEVDGKSSIKTVPNCKNIFDLKSVKVHIWKVGKWIL